MSVETSRTVKEFLSSNSIRFAAIMGGEFFCNPDWKEIFDIVIPGLESVRLVSNGDWNDNAADFLARFPNLRIGISKDRWHTNANVERAAKLCEKHGIKHRIAADDETTSESVVPVGNGQLHLSTYSMFQCYCQNPEHKYSFLIDEDGWIYKCGFGQWEYATVAKYAKGGFAAVFKEFNQIFYREFIPNCRECARAYAITKQEKFKPR
jgi:MoaA/NifB/PqqE/SkfB family radical SAM enzyme